MPFMSGKLAELQFKIGAHKGSNFKLELIRAPIKLELAPIKLELAPIFLGMQLTLHFVLQITI